MDGGFDLSDQCQYVTATGSQQRPSFLQNLNVYSVVQVLVADAIQSSCRYAHINPLEDQIDQSLAVRLLRLQTERHEPARLRLTVEHTGHGINAGLVQKHCRNLFDVNLDIANACSFGSSVGDLYCDGQISILTTDNEDDMVRCYVLQLSNNGQIIDLAQMPSLSKPAGYFSGTESYFEVQGCIEDLAYYALHLLEKIALLRLKGQKESDFAKVCMDKPFVQIMIDLRLENFADTTIENLCGGTKARYFRVRAVDDAVHMSFHEALNLPLESGPLEHFRMGVEEDCKEAAFEHMATNPMLREDDEVQWVVCAGQAGFDAGNYSTPWTIQCVLAATVCDTCLEARWHNTARVHFFLNHFLAPVEATIMSLLKTKVNWPRFGLAIKEASSSPEGFGLLQWDSRGFPGALEIHLHMHKGDTNGRPDKLLPTTLAKLVKGSVEAALNELKEKQPVLFSSKHQAQVLQCVPDLSRCIAGLVSSSHDGAFQQECLQILGLDSDGLADLEPEVRLRLSAIVEQLDDEREEAEKLRKTRNKGKRVPTSDDSGEVGTPEEDEYMQEDDDCGMDEVPAGCVNGIWDYL